jgi:hypothetical protein
MSTRSLTHFYHKPHDEQAPQTPLLTLYRQSDGYLSGHGALISKTFKGRQLVNGYSSALTQINGMMNAPTMLIGAYYRGDDPDEPVPCGNLYITGAGSINEGEEYTYHLYPNKDESGIHLRIVGQMSDEHENVVYDGPLDDFDPLMQGE